MINVTSFHRGLTLDELLNVVCNYMNVDRDEVEGRRRRIEIVMARHVYCYLARKHTSYVLKNIAKLLGDRDHTTAIHSINTMSDLMDTDDKYVEIVAKVETLLRVNRSKNIETRRLRLKRA